MNALAASDLDVAAAAYERLVLDVTGLTEVPWERWVASYAELSRGLTAERELRLGDAASGLWGDEDARVVAALVFGQRTFLTMRRLFTEHPLPGPTVLDFGAGSGAAALAAGVSGARRLLLVEASPATRELGGALLSHALGPSIELASSATPPAVRVDAVLAAHSLNELALQRDPSAITALVAGWLDGLPDGGRLYLLEPGLQQTARALQQLRDRLRARARLLGPCTHAAPCPLLDRSTDWCHMAWPRALGPIARELVRRAGHQADRIVYAHLVLERARPAPSERAYRLLQVQPRGKGPTLLHLCGGPHAQHLALGVLERGELGTLVRGLEVGARLELDEDAVAQRGDGPRLTRADGLRRA